MTPESLFLTNLDSTFSEWEVGEGEEVFITGLFKHHYGENRNLPIVRVGNIAALPEEKIQCGGHKRDAYLIEARSIGGLSGSPVFLNPDLIRNIGNEIKINQERLPLLIGLIHGHYDSNLSEVDNISEDTNSTEKINAGIAIVTPISKLIEIFEQDKVKEIERTKSY